MEFMGVVAQAGLNETKLGHRVVVWVLLYLLEHTGKDFQSEILLVT